MPRPIVKVRNRGGNSVIIVGLFVLELTIVIFLLNDFLNHEMNLAWIAPDQRDILNFTFTGY